MNETLPPLPEPIIKIGVGNSTWNKYNAAQMQARPQPVLGEKK